MKNLILLAVLLVSINSFGSVAFTIEGELRENTGADNELVHMILTAEGRELKVVNYDFETAGCKTGLFEIVNNYYPENTYSLLEIYACYAETKEDFQYCPAVYEPVCGMPKKTSCYNRFCIQVMPTPSTFSNYCELYNAKAKFISKGNCEESNY